MTNIKKYIFIALATATSALLLSSCSSTGTSTGGFNAPSTGGFSSVPSSHS